MKKRVLSLLLILMFLLSSITGCNTSTEPEEPEAQEKKETETVKTGLYKPGTYTASAPGRNGDVTVEVTFDETTILDAKVTDHLETPYIGTFAIELMPAALVKDQHLIIDTVSGATQSSMAVKKALLDCVTQAGGDANAISAPVEPDPIKQAVEECDVVVVGGGGSGISAALELKKQGLDVILLEKMDILGGTSMTASTYISGYGTSVHEAQGVNLTKEEFMANEATAGGTTAKFKELFPEAASRYADIIPETCEWLIEIGADLSRLIDGKVQMGPADGGTIGEQVVPAIIKQLDVQNVDYRLGNKVVSLIKKDGAARGVVVETDGGNYEIHSKAVVMAFGGYLQNFDMVAEYTPQYADYGTTWSAGSTGEGLQMCVDLDGYLGAMDTITINPTGYSGMGKRAMISFTPFRYNGCILVGQSTGTRFANELANYTAIASAMPEGKAFAIIDQKVMDSSSTIADYYKFGYLTKGDTIEELAEKIGLDPIVLRETIDKYTEYAQQGEDKDFARPQMPSDLTQGPFYSTPVEPANHNAVGGVVTNGRGQALREDDSVIEGLYVAGNAADNTRIPNSITGAFAFSRVIAQCVAEDLK